MRFFALICLTGLMAGATLSQITSSVFEVVTVHSQNGAYYLKSIPWDNQSPSLEGITEVFATGSSTPIYTVSRGFDSVHEGSNNLILSDDGLTIFFLIPDYSDEKIDGLKSISFYRRGELVKSYTLSDVMGCDLGKERCSLVYNNFDDVVDRELSKIGSREYRKVFRQGVGDEEKFLNEYPLFSAGSLVYLTDSKKRIHRFSLTDAKLVDSRPFADVFDEIKTKAQATPVKLDRVQAPTFLDFPKLRSGLDATKALADDLGMAPYDIFNTKDEKYKRYGLKVSGYLLRDGSFQLTDLDLFSDLPRETIEGFFAQNRFDTAQLPSIVDRWFLREEYFYLRNANKKIAIKERQKELVAERAELKKRLVAETIGDRYIPKDLGDALAQLDKELPEVTRNEMLALKTRDDMIQYHFGLGMWMRNNWGLWGGSRLQQYFMKKGIDHPDDMSSVIMSHYWDWLKGDRDAWRRWELNPKKMLDNPEN